MKKWKPVLLGYRRVSNSCLLSGMDLAIIPGLSLGRHARQSLRIRQILNRPHRPTVSAFEAAEADLVHVHFGTDAVEVWPSVRKLGLPLVVTLHGYDITKNPWWWQSGKGGWRRALYPQKLRKMAKHPSVHFIAVSRAIGLRAAKYGIREEKLSVAYVGVNTGKFAPVGGAVSARSKRVLFVGRLVEKKGVEYLIRAFFKVLRRVPAAELYIVGDGPLREGLEARAAECANSVRFLGALTTRDVGNEMAAARVFCLPSITADDGDSEGFPTVLMEAQASGLPVVTSALGETGESLRPGKTGYAFREKDVAALSERLHELLTDDDLADRFSRNAREFVVDNFDIRERTKKLEDYYDEVISKSF